MFSITKKVNKSGRKFRIGTNVIITSCPLKSFVNKGGKIIQKRKSDFFQDTFEWLVFVASLGKSVWVFDSQLSKLSLKNLLKISKGEYKYTDLLGNVWIICKESLPKKRGEYVYWIGECESLQKNFRENNKKEVILAINTFVSTKTVNDETNI